MFREPKGFAAGGRDANHNNFHAARFLSHGVPFFFFFMAACMLIQNSRMALVAGVVAILGVFAAFFCEDGCWKPIGREEGLRRKFWWQSAQEC